MDVLGESMSDDWSSALSPREREVALLVARGLANKEIARELGLSQGTVKLHVHSIFLKLRVRKLLRSGVRQRSTLIDLMSEQPRSIELTYRDPLERSLARPWNDCLVSRRSHADES